MTTSKMLKPQLAIDTCFTDMTYPKMGFPKIDGVRGCHITGSFTGRSLLPLGNVYTTKLFSDPKYAWLDGEMTLEGRTTGPELCNSTNSAVASHKGEPHVVLNVFDYLHPDLMDKPYLLRYMEMEKLVADLPFVKIIAFRTIDSAEEAEAYYNECLELEYEGAIFRDPRAVHKSGRATAKLQDFWRAKPTSDKDAIVLRVEEGQRNENPEYKNALGETTRSTDAAGMVPNGMVGTLVCEDVKSKQEIRVAPGKMTHDERKAWFDDQTQIVGQGIKYRSLDTGTKHAPRHSRFIVRRTLADMEAV